MSKEFEHILNLVPEGASVIDIGCGEGELLSVLEAEKGVKGFGIEIEPERVAAAVSAGLSVLQGDADEELSAYPEDAFDVAILNRSLQVVKEPKALLEQCLRIAKLVIVVIPNFGHIRNRLYLGFKGRMPVNSRLPYEWYETPNIHFCTVRDMVALAGELGAEAVSKQVLTGGGKAFNFNIGLCALYANWFGEQGVFLLRKD